MPVPAIVYILGGILTLATAATVVVFWHKILQWAEDSLFPWIDSNIPSLKDLVRLAFSSVDKGVVLVRNAWNKLREYLIKQVIKIERNTQRQWVRKATSIIVKKLESGRTVPVKVETEEVLDWDELPEDLRQDFLCGTRKNLELDVIQIREKELQDMEMST